MRTLFGTLMKEKRIELTAHERLSYDFLSGNKRGEEAELLPDWLRRLNGARHDSDRIKAVPIINSTTTGQNREADTAAERIARTSAEDRKEGPFHRAES